MIKRLIVGMMQTNCYILYFENKDCFIIDPGDDGEIIVKFIDENELNPKAILITHAHFDHIGAIDYIYDYYRIPVYTHERSKDLFENPQYSLSSYYGDFIVNSPIQYIKDCVCIEDYKFNFYLLEGHCKGCCMIHYPAENLMFSGDMLFKGSIGRFDFPTSSIEEMRNSIEKIKQFDFDAILLPGHGESSSLYNEFKSNYYFN